MCLSTTSLSEKQRHFNTFIQDGKEMASVLYTYRSCVKALPQCKAMFFFMWCRGYVGIHSSGFRNLMLKPELLRSIVDSGFEHPSEGKVLNSCLMLTFVNSMN
ncbi:hypothetical protein V6Z11_A11G115600 [Gossypium hirsutum]